MREKHTLKDHYEMWVSVLKWLKSNWVVVGGLLTFYGTTFSSIVIFLLIPVFKPIVVPIIESHWEIKVAPYDSAIYTIYQRLDKIEDECGLIEAEEPED